MLDFIKAAAAVLGKNLKEAPLRCIKVLIERSM